MQYASPRIGPVRTWLNHGGATEISSSQTVRSDLLPAYPTDGCCG
eukprot:COSAG01_NODE_32133_length_586_cov_0.632444_2_plen_44_part_01